MLDRGAKRKWSESYLVLTHSKERARSRNREAYIGDPNNALVPWISAQSAPPMLAPYSFGAHKSRLLAMLEQGHNGVKLSREEFDKIACWIDLLVPYGGDYIEANAWTPEEAKRYQYFLDKRQRWEAEEARNIQAFLQGGR